MQPYPTVTSYIQVQFYCYWSNLHNFGRISWISKILQRFSIKVSVLFLSGKYYTRLQGIINIASLKNKDINFRIQKYKYFHELFIENLETKILTIFCLLSNLVQPPCSTSHLSSLWVPQTSPWTTKQSAVWRRRGVDGLVLTAAFHRRLLISQVNDERQPLGWSKVCSSTETRVLSNPNERVPIRLYPHRTKVKMHQPSCPWKILGKI